MTPPHDGVVVALWTPTNSQGNIDGSALRRLIEFTRSKGVSGLMPLGSTGEFVFLDLTRRRAALESIREVSGSLPVIANISAINPQEVKLLGLDARRLDCAAVTMLPPWYYTLPEADLLEF